MDLLYPTVSTEYFVYTNAAVYYVLLQLYYAYLPINVLNLPILRTAGTLVLCDMIAGEAIK